MSTLRQTPDGRALLLALKGHQVDFVLAGSVAVKAWSVDIGEPGDLDIIPDTAAANLSRLAEVLSAIDAAAFAVTGEWIEDDREVVWREFEPDDPRRFVPLPAPDPSSIATFDSLFPTRYGTLDVVPKISGTFEDLRRRASNLTVLGVAGITVMSIEDLLIHLTAPRRAKDSARVSGLRAIQLAHLGEG